MNLSSISRPLLCCCIGQIFQNRTAIVFERVARVPLVRLDKPVTSRRLRNKMMIYKIREDEGLKPIPDIQCVLTRNVDGVGVEGEVVTVNRKLFRSKLLPSGAAVYASPENKEYYSNRSTGVRRSQHALQTYRLLCGMNLKIPMNTKAEWTLTPSHVQVAFRRVKIYVDNIDSISLPEESITNQTSEQTPFYVKVKVNGLDEANVKCYIRPYSTNYEEMSELPQPPDVPTFRNRHEVEKELSDAGLYYGTVDISSQ